MHQNRASLFASDFCRRRGYRREFRSEDHFYPFYSQKKSRFASDFLRRGNRASWGLKRSRDFFGSGKNRRRSRRESRDFGALRCYPVLPLHGLKLCKFVSRSDLVLISFWMLTTPWIFYPISLFRRASRLIVFATKVAPECFCLVRLKVPLLIRRGMPHPKYESA